MPASILIVEDEKEIRELLVFTLLRDGYEVIEAETAEVALEKIDNRLPDLILVDWMLPGMDGIDAETNLPRIYLSLCLLPEVKKRTNCGVLLAALTTTLQNHFRPVNYWLESKHSCAEVAAPKTT